MLQRGALGKLVESHTTEALACGVLQPIVTQSEFLEDRGVRFLVRVIAELQKKEQSRGTRGPAGSPFLTQEPTLHVADLSPTHMARLNRYPVVKNHLLIVTREYEEQESPLNPRDFAALATCMREYAGLAFYNGGPTAGASQSHKHLQLVPLPLAPTGPRIPLEEQIVTGALPFRHAAARLDPACFEAPEEAANALEAAYRDLLRKVGIVSAAPRLAPYNLLATREWMLVVPRSQDRFEAISLNALAFAGALLVKNQLQLERLRRCGPMAALEAVTMRVA